MNCCCPHAYAAGKLFSFFARRYRKRFEKRGFEPSQVQLLYGLGQAGYQEANLLEIGSGVGHLHQSLLEQGAAQAVGVELAPKMITEAEAWAAERGLAERTHYLEGDFMQLVKSLKTADVTILDKVVCCYPDAEGLVHASLDRTWRVYALTYPRKRMLVQLGVMVLAFVLRIMRSEFRPYVHDPKALEGWILARGFEKHFEARTSMWLTQVYLRDATYPA